MEQTMSAMESKGGEWTERKLKALSGYISAFNNALKNRPYTRIYVDAFAGSGARQLPELPLYDNDPEIADFARGSAQIALECDPPFDRVIFIDSSEENVAKLKTLMNSSNHEHIELHHGDANAKIVEIAGAWNQGFRGVLFLDPFGCQVEWRALEAVAKTKAIDVWLLFPSNAVRRMLPNDPSRLQDSWRERLNRLFGTDGWYQHFYVKKVPATDLFGAAEDRLERHVSLDRIEEFYRGRLNHSFSAGVAERTLRLGPRDRDWLYAMFFICSNPSQRARNVSFRIANHLIDKWND